MVSGGKCNTEKEETFLGIYYYFKQEMELFENEKKGSFPGNCQVFLALRKFELTSSDFVESYQRRNCEVAEIKGTFCIG